MLNDLYFHKLVEEQPDPATRDYAEHATLVRSFSSQLRWHAEA